MKTRKSCLVVAGLFVLVILSLPVLFLGIRYLVFASRQAARPSLQIISPGINETVKVHNPIHVQVGANAQGSPVTRLQFYADGFLAGEQRGPADSLIGIWDWFPKTEGIHTLSFLAYNVQNDANLVVVQVTALPGSDRDADGVDDEQDECPDQAGAPANDGCPVADDRDRDGISDSTDLCPDEAGSLEDEGCPAASVPDRDRDGTLDVADRCPDIPGLAEWAGCPAGAWTADRDGDGLPDFMDTCPDDAGLTERDGCPSVVAQDSDGDGVPDISDACPDQPGPASNSGCPLEADRDHDGVADSADACPDEAGLAESDGCPPDEGLTDTDGDGVIDAVDRCIDEPGPLENEGCPLPDDRDGDGVPDAEDHCPDLAGVPENDGCPRIPLIDPDLLGRFLGFSAFSFCERFPAACNTDGDGLMNADDACPEEAGPVENYGCPTFPNDQDGDGVLDEYDNCDAEAGDPANLGCPDPADSDRDGIPLAFDACPDQAGPSDNHGCPRAGRNTDIEIELLALNTDAGWPGVYCYLDATGLPVMVRIPESGMLSSSGSGSWSLPGDRRRATFSIPEDRGLSFTVLCWGQPGDPSLFPQPLGTIMRTHGYESWDNQIRIARGESGGDWFEVIYRLCRGSCP